MRPKPRASLGLVESVAILQTFDLKFVRHAHDDEPIHRLIEIVLDDEGGLIKHDGFIPLERLADEPRASFLDTRMSHLLEFSPSLGIGEHDRAERLPIDRPIRSDDLGPTRANVVPGGLARLDDLSSERVRVDDRRAECAQISADRALAGRDATCQSIEFHSGEGVPQSGVQAISLLPCPCLVVLKPAATQAVRAGIRARAGRYCSPREVRFFAMQTPCFFKRLVYALAVLIRFLFDGRFAAPVLALWKGERPSGPVLDVTPKPEALPEPQPAPEPPKTYEAASALQLLAILQREGRLVDFLQEDISNYDDGDIGAAARQVHEGCRKALERYLPLEPLRTEAESAPVVVEAGFDPAAVRLTGEVTGEPPFAGSLRHHGWRATEVKLPALAIELDPRIIAPAEVEL